MCKPNEGKGRHKYNKVEEGRPDEKSVKPKSEKIIENDELLPSFVLAKTI